MIDDVKTKYGTRTTDVLTTRSAADVLAALTSDLIRASRVRRDAPNVTVMTIGDFTVMWFDEPGYVLRIAFCVFTALEATAFC